MLFCVNLGAVSYRQKAATGRQFAVYGVYSVWLVRASSRKAVYRTQWSIVKIRTVRWSMVRVAGFEVSTQPCGRSWTRFWPILFGECSMSHLARVSSNAIELTGFRPRSSTCASQTVHVYWSLQMSSRGWLSKCYSRHPIQASTHF